MSPIKFSRPARGALALAAALSLAAGVFAGPAVSQDATPAVEATYGEIEEVFGKVPDFVKSFPKSGIAGAWAQLKGQLISGDTALTAREKALISLAVAAQIPCHYCVWSDTNDARRAGATEEEIAEAVATAALTRHWSTWFNGMQVDFEAFKADLGGDVAPNAAAQ